MAKKLLGFEDAFKVATSMRNMQMAKRFRNDKAIEKTNRDWERAMKQRAEKEASNNKEQ